MSTEMRLPGTVTGINDQATTGPSRAEYQKSARRKLSKADIVNGTNQTREHYVKAWDGYVTIRPLSEGEWQHIKQMTMRGIKQSLVINPETGKEESSMSVDYSEQMDGATDADRLTVAYGLSSGDEQWTPDEVTELRPAGVVEEIAAEVFKLSGIRVPNQRRKRDATDTEYQEDEGGDLTEQVDSFPENA